MTGPYGCIQFTKSYDLSHKKQDVEFENIQVFSIMEHSVQNKSEKQTRKKYAHEIHQRFLCCNWKVSEILHPRKDLFD